NMSNFPVISPEFSLKDFGNITCGNGNLEHSQQQLAEKVAVVLKKDAKSVVLGGGHEVTFAHYSGIRKAFPDKRIGII
ncbi:arginase family protein, partial [Vibrio mediterranei]|uniref:arginase family protein n=1 Tax=Vibrio mediterranei TaxID=689 RepID=UPI004068EB6C